MDNLAGIIQSRAWDALLEIQQRLNIAIELFDDGLTPLLPVASDRGPLVGSRAAGRLDDESLKEVLRRATHSRAQQIATLRDGRIACTPIIGPQGDVAGVLLVLDVRTPASDDLELRRIGSCLARAIETHLTTSSEVASELHEISSLYRVLSEAAATGLQREVMRAYVEALAVWLGVESWVYLQDLSGRFSMKISLPGSDRSLAPMMIEADPVPEEATAIQLSAGDRERLGFHCATDVVVSHARGRTPSPWLVATPCRTDVRQEARLALYVDVLGRMLGEVAAVESSRLTWAMLQHLLGAVQSQDSAVADALRELSAVVDGSACLAVFKDRVRVLTIGDAECAPTVPEPVRRPDRVVLPLDVLSPYSAVVAISRLEGSPFAPREEHLLLTAVATLNPSLSSVLQRLPTTGERRSSLRSFDQIIERYATDTAPGSGDISVLVVSVPEATLRRKLAQEWMGRVRGQLRAADLAGQLGSGEIGILLPDTSMSSAHIVAQRVKQLMRSDAAIGRDLAIGVACRPAGPWPPQSLLGSARAAIVADEARQPASG